MAEIFFFSTPESKADQKQMEMLKNAGNTIHCKDITAQDWSRDKLLPFVRGRDPLEIMNSAAPGIREGRIDPVLITFEEALALMVESPELIKGPLLVVDGLHIQGARDTRLQRYLGNAATSRPKIVRRKKNSRLSNERRMWDYWQNISQFAQPGTAAP